MANFKYKAISHDGAQVSGIIEAFDEFEAIDRIKQTCRIVSSIQQVDRNELHLLEMNVTAPQIKEDRLALMCSQFSIVIKAGMPIVRAIQLIAGQTEDKVLRNLLQNASEGVASGYGLAQSFESKGGKLLPNSFIETVRAGEESGTLDVSFDRLYTYYDKSFRLKKKVTGAMGQPLFLIVMAIVVIAIIMIKVMPTFTEIYESAGVDLPEITLVLIGISNFFVNYWLPLVAVVVAAAIGLRLIGRTEKGRLFFAERLLHVKILGEIVRMKGASQFANTMATMLTSGLSIVNAVTICSRVLDNYYLGRRLATAISGLEEGKPLGWCLQRCGCFPDLLVEMTAVGDETGSLEDTLNTIGRYYDSETELASDRALSALQPIITIVMGVIIGFILIALYMPMFNLGSAIG